MNVLSLFSGVGGFDLGLEQAGMTTIYQCEWDKHATNILNRHWPHTPKWGDITTLTAQEILRHGTPPDIVAWGSPCQDLSVAGKRAGLEGERSGLFHEGMRLIRELRKETNNEYPRISIWENVAGALSSNNGADFGIILDEMAEAGAMVIEWSLLDAQHFGIPQRRRRVFVIAIFDPAIALNCPDPLLPVSESVRRDSAKGKSKGQAASRTVTEGVGGDGAWWDGGDTAEAITTTSNEQRMPDKNRFQAVVEETVVGTLAARDYKGVGNQYVDEGKLIVEQETFTGSSFAQYTEGVGTLRSNGGDLGGGSETVVVEPYVKSRRAQSVAIGIQGNVIGRQDHNGPAGKGHTEENEPMFTLTSTDVHAVAFSHTQGLSPQASEDAWPTLRSGGGGHAVAYDSIVFDDDRRVGPRIFDETIGTLQAFMGTGGNNTPMVAQHIEPSMAVRRLTPLECERLMGWPDDHTRWKADGSEQADTHRYKQCGNGVATPVARWIAEHILNIPK